MEPIAVIGLACRFPGAPDAERFWELLADGRCAVREVPADRWDVERFYSEDAAAPGRSNTRWGGFLEDIESFDAGFFRLSPREADAMDPQQRLLLEVGTEAFEDAGLPLEALRGSSTGVFVGAMYNDHGSRLIAGDPAYVDAFSGTGSLLSVVANRLSYSLDLRGPSLVVDAACSSSLVALHQACASLHSGECDTVLVGGVSVMLSPAQAVFFTKAGLTAPDGLCKAFDARADGIVRGEGCGAVVLKTLGRAQADGDRVLAVIRGSAINHNGRSNGLGAPSPMAQEALLKAAYQAAGLAPSDVQYVEAHGTGTSLGDIGEARALGAVVGVGRNGRGACRIGSVKSNLGHLESASGMAGLIKVCLALAKRQIPPTLHVHEPNPKIPFERLGLRVQCESESWPEGRARAGVSAFGLGGCNVHVVLEESMEGRSGAGCKPDMRAGETRDQLLLLSARSDEALRTLAEKTASWLAARATSDPAGFADLAHSSARRRSHHSCRLALRGSTLDEWRSGLGTFLAGEGGKDCFTGRRTTGARRLVVFLFGGQGSPWWNAGRTLLREEPTFARHLGAWDAQLAPVLGWSVARLLRAPWADTRLASTRLAQPALFALQVSLAETWREWGVEPDAVLGHSLGEIAAAVVAGALSPQDAALLLRARGTLMESASEGRMWSVRLPIDEARRLLEAAGSRASIAAENGPGNVVLAGAPGELEALRAPLASVGAVVRELPVDRAFHSRHMEPLAGPLHAALAELRPRSARCTFVSSCTGTDLDGKALGPDYWANQLLQPVRFGTALEWLLDDDAGFFLELGPSLFSAAVRRAARARGREAQAAASIPASGSVRSALLDAGAALYCAGHDLAWREVVPEGRYVALPSYPWQRRRHRARFAGSQPLAALPEPARSGASSWVLGGSSPSWLHDHRVMGRLLVPGVAYLEAALRALAPREGEDVALEEVVFHQTLFLRDAEEIELRTRFFDDGGVRRFAVESASPGAASESLRASGAICVPTPDSSEARAETPTTIRARCEREVSGDEFYAALLRNGFAYGSRMRGVQRLWIGDREALAEVALPDEERAALAEYRVHPALFDATAHTLFATFLLTEGSSPGEQWLPQGARRVSYHRSPPHSFFVHARIQPAEAGTDVRVGDLRALDPSGACYFECCEGRLRRVGRAASETPPASADVYQVRWERLRSIPASATRVPPSWILVATAGGVADVLARRAHARGDTVFTIRLAVDDDSEPTSGSVVRDETELRNALREIGHRAGSHLRAVLVWDPKPPTDFDPRDPRTAERSGCAAALAMLQEAVARSAAGSHLWFVTRGAVDTGGPAEPLDGLFQAPLWGLGRALEREHADVWGGLVDLDPVGIRSDEGEALFEHLDAADTPEAERQVAFRNGDRWVPRLVPLSLPPNESVALHCRTDARYLVTGGLGDLGLRIAAELAARGARSLVLVGRTPLPPREQWDAPALDPRTAARVAAVRDLEARGIHVHTVAVDVADASAFGTWLDTLEDDGGPAVRGVVHAAGIAVGALADQLDTAGLEAVLAPKVVGGWALHRAFPERTLDFFVLFSSAASLLGTLGQGLASYAAANAFLDALAAHRRRNGATAVSLGWGAWGEIGLYARSGREQAHAERGLDAMTPEAALERFAQLAEGTHAHVAVLSADWRRFRKAYGAAARSPFLTHVVAAAETQSETASRDASESGPAPRIPATDATLLSRLQATVGEILGYPAHDVDPALPLSELGSDSIIAVELRETIEADYGVALPIRSFLEDPSLEQLAEQVRGACAAPVAGFHAPSGEAA